MVLLIGLTTVAGCVSSAKQIKPPVEVPPAFSPSGSQSAPDRWWLAFGDPELNQLVDEALHSNLDLLAAWQRLRAARAVADRAGAARLPILEGVGEAERRWPRDSGAQGREDLWLGLSARYEIDLWGRIDAAADAARLRMRASHADYQTVALSISAEVARTWCLLIEAQGRVALLEQQIATNQRVLRLLENRFTSGLIRGVDLLRQKQLIEATRADKLTAEIDAQLASHQLAVLLGRPAQEPVVTTRRRLPALPPVPAAGLPSQLVTRRPDIRRDYQRLLAADRDLAAAIAERYPRISVSAEAGTAHGTSATLFKNWFFALAGNLVAPIFDAGERAAEVDRSEAVKRELLYQYGQTTLVALREVEDALVQERKQRERVAILERRAELAEQSYQRLQVEYIGGIAGYIEVLLALSEEQQLRRDLLTEHRLLLEYRIALYRALAGGFEPVGVAT